MAEKNNNDRFGEVFWTEEDLVNALELQEVPATKRNIETLRAVCENEKGFVETMIQAGWEWIYGKINSFEHEWDTCDDPCMEAGNGSDETTEQPSTHIAFATQEDLSNLDVARRIFTPGRKLYCIDMKDPYEPDYLKALPEFRVLKDKLGKAVLFCGDFRNGFFVYDECALLLANTVEVVESREVDLTKYRCRFFVPGNRANTYITMLRNRGVSSVLYGVEKDGYTVYVSNGEVDGCNIPIGKISCPYRLPEEFCDPKEFAESIRYISPYDTNARVIFYVDTGGELICKEPLPSPANNKLEKELSPYIIGKDPLLLFPIFAPCLGIVDCVDDDGRVHCKWENGRSLSLDPTMDEYYFVEDKKEDFK